MKEILLGVLAVAGLMLWIFLICFSTVKLMDRPLVYRSWSTKECVIVEPEEAGTCDDLPKRYEIVWVK